MNDLFRKFAATASHAVGSPWAFITAVVIVIGWAASGPLFHYSDTWQLVINTGTTIITFLMVFLIQNTQNRDAKAIHLKLDEMIKATKGARNSMIDLDNLSDEQLKQLEESYKRICAEDEDADIGHVGKKVLRKADERKAEKKKK
jgi:low affinity Fe/Cu permease